MIQQCHGRETPGVWILSFAAAGECSVANACAPDHTNCNPAARATVATTTFSFCAGTFRASKQPITTPGTPPARSCKRMGALIVPNVQGTDIPIRPAPRQTKL